VIGAAELPLALRTRKGELFLSHTAKGEVWTADRERDGEALAFECEVPKATVDNLVTRVGVVLQSYGAWKSTGYRWTIASTEANPALCKRIYNQVVQFPATSYSFSGVLKLTGVEGIDQLRLLFGNRDVQRTYFCSFTLAPSSAGAGEFEAWLEVLTRREGHQLRMQLRPPDDRLASSIGRKLGLGFTGRRGR
jgi:hypothetical protein